MTRDVEKKTSGTYAPMLLALDEIMQILNQFPEAEKKKIAIAISALVES